MINKSVLIIGYWYLPNNSARTFHTQGIISSLLKNGYKVELIVPSENNKTSVIEEKHNFTIHRVKRGIFLNKNVNAKMYNNNLVNKNSLIKKFIKKIIWPDKTIEWTLNSYRYIAKQLNIEDYKQLITIGLPISSHITGALIKKKKSSIIWLADYGDPYTFNPGRTREKRFMDPWIERNIMKKVDRIIIPHKESLKAYTDLKIPRDKINVIPQLFQYQPISAPEYNIQSKFINLIYAGTLYEDIRNPIEFLKGYVEAFKKRNDLCLHFFGEKQDLLYFLNQITHEEPEDLNIRVNSYIERRKLLGIMKEMDILVNISNISSLQLPSKLIDYVNSGNCILNIGRKLNDEFTNIPNESIYIEKFLINYNSEGQSINYDEILEFYNYEINSSKYISLLRERE
ncbi:glycosyltransferase family protein [Priestia megaterium]|uniref:glycosyltransferase family 4 protein n=1 Tax=Priestia megaterium TaxID=1404 RepID=UPI0012B7D0FD|nr:glycosyltransferase family 4 protein [Priestia megaterium]